MRPEIDHMQEYLQWCRTSMLPFWLQQGIDRKYGGFFEALLDDGRPDLTGQRRVRVASRQIYAFSHGHHLQWIEAKTQILNGVDWLMDRAWASNSEPGFLHLVDDRSRPLDQTRDLYDHAFHILGLSWAYRVTKDAQILSAAKQTYDFVEEALAAKTGGWFENLQQSLPRRQNPHMHMFEALLALYEATQDQSYLARADQISQLLFERFTDRKTGLLFEEFDDRLRPQLPSRIEPGHMMEWVWLLHQRAQFPVPAPVYDLPWLSLAESIGKQKNGLLIDACDQQGNILHDSSRLWAQCEWLKALLVSDMDNKRRNQKIEALCKLLFNQYLNQNHTALWIDAISTCYKPLVDRVPASIVYHLTSAAAQIEQYTTQPQILESSCQSP